MPKYVGVFDQNGVKNAEIVDNLEKNYLFCIVKMQKK